MLGNGKKNIGYDLSYYTNNLYPALAFVSTFRTTTPSESITLPYEVAGTYSGTINWGDGTTSVNSYANRTHVYAVANDYKIIIQGETTGWNFNTGSNVSKDKIRSVDQWGTLKLINTTFMYNFYNCLNLNLSNVIGVLNTTGLTSLLGLFEACPSLTSVNNINSWNLSNIQYLNEFFYECTNFNQTLNLNVPSAITTAAMFKSCFALNSSITINCPNVTDMGNMFFACTSLNSSVNLTTQNVTNMVAMFQSCTSFNQLVLLDTSNVVYMQNMFFNCGAFNQEINFDTGNVQNMAAMFALSYAYNQPLNLNTSSVTSMAYMFTNCFAFNQDISSWDVSNVADFTDFMAGKTFNDYDSQNLTAIYVNWSLLAVQPNLNINFGTIKYRTGGIAGKAVLLAAPNLWTITDGGLI